jgi:hypothetical protein
MARRAAAACAALVLVLTACDAPREEPQSAPTPFLALPLEDALDAFLAEPSATTAELLALKMADSGDVGYVPHLVDLLRIGWSQGLAATAEVALDTLTGVQGSGDRQEAYVRYGTWMRSHEVVPADGYLDWKRAVYGTVHSTFEPMLEAVDDPILASRLQWGGVGRGDIPELNEPETIPVTEATHMTPDEIVFGAVAGGQARAYPLRILGHHELANDTLGGVPVALVYCSLCRSAILFDRRVGDATLTFETSGLLLESNKVMVDVETDTLWEQLRGAAVAGPHEGERLALLPSVVMTWADWAEAYPGGDVLALPAERFVGPEGYERPYSYEPGDAYAGYYAAEEVWFPVLDTPDVFALKDEVIGVERGGAVLALSVDALAETGPVVLPLGAGSIVVVPTRGGARVYEGEVPADADGRVLDPSTLRAEDDSLVLDDGSALPRLASVQSFWFAWYARWPQTRWWPES